MKLCDNIAVGTSTLIDLPLRQESRNEEATL